MSFPEALHSTRLLGGLHKAACEVVAFAAISLLDRYLETLHTAIPLEQMQVNSSVQRL